MYERKKENGTKNWLSRRGEPPPLPPLRKKTFYVLYLLVFYYFMIHKWKIIINIWLIICKEYILLLFSKTREKDGNGFPFHPWRYPSILPMFCLKRFFFSSFKYRIISIICDLPFIFLQLIYQWELFSCFLKKKKKHVFCSLYQKSMAIFDIYKNNFARKAYRLK